MYIYIIIIQARLSTHTTGSVTSGGTSQRPKYVFNRIFSLCLVANEVTDIYNNIINPLKLSYQLIVNVYLDLGRTKKQCTCTCICTVENICSLNTLTISLIMLRIERGNIPTHTHTHTHTHSLSAHLITKLVQTMCDGFPEQLSVTITARDCIQMYSPNRFRNL